MRLVASVAIAVIVHMILFYIELPRFPVNALPSSIKTLTLEITSMGYQEEKAKASEPKEDTFFLEEPLIKQVQIQKPEEPKVIKKTRKQERVRPRSDLAYEQGSNSIQATIPILDGGNPHPGEVPQQVSEKAPQGPARITEASYTRPGYENNPEPAYPPLARRRGYEGRVLLEVIVGVDGKAKGLLVKESSGYEILDSAALEAVKGWSFTPAMENGIPIEAKVMIPIKFCLK